MRHNQKGFTIIELLIVVIVVGILAATGLAKYQNFAESSRRKTCLAQLHALDTGIAVWEMSNQAFGENSKCAWGFTTRTGKLTDTAITPRILAVAEEIPAIGDSQATVGGARPYVNASNSGPMGSVIRDDNIWICPSALARYYNGEIQNVPDDYMDTSGGGGSTVAPHGGSPIGLGGRYLFVIIGKGNTVIPTKMTNGGFPAGWITASATSTNVNSDQPCPQVPMKLAICGNFGTFGTGETGAGAASVPGATPINQGGPVGPDNSTLNRHSARW